MVKPSRRTSATELILVETALRRQRAARSSILLAFTLIVLQAPVCFILGITSGVLGDTGRERDTLPLFEV